MVRRCKPPCRRLAPLILQAPHGRRAAHPMDRPPGEPWVLPVRGGKVGNHWNMATTKLRSSFPYPKQVHLDSVALALHVTLATDDPMNSECVAMRSWKRAVLRCLQIQAMSTPRSKRFTRFYVCKKAEAHERTEQTKGASATCSPENSRQIGAPKIPLHPLPKQNN